jgi:hypothetical protein
MLIGMMLIGMDITLTPIDLPLDSARERLQGMLEEYRFLDSHLRAMGNTNFRVCLFGSARITPTDPLYYTVFELSCALATRGMDVITAAALV